MVAVHRKVVFSMTSAEATGTGLVQDSHPAMP